MGSQTLLPRHGYAPSPSFSLEEMYRSMCKQIKQEDAHAEALEDPARLLSMYLVVIRNSPFSLNFANKIRRPARIRQAQRLNIRWEEMATERHLKMNAKKTLSIKPQTSHASSTTSARTELNQRLEQQWQTSAMKRQERLVGMKQSDSPTLQATKFF